MTTRGGGSSLDNLRKGLINKTMNLAKKANVKNHRKKKVDEIKLAINEKKKPKFVALMANENRIILADLLKRLKWKKDKNVTAEHILRHKFSHSYSKSVEASGVL